MNTLVTTVGVAVVALLLGVLAAVGVILFQLRKVKAPSTDVSTSLQTLIQNAEQGNIQVATMAEKLAHIEPITQTVAGTQLELRSLTERIANVEQAQANAAEGVGTLSNTSVASFSELKTLAASLAEATDAIRSELARAKDDLTELQAYAQSDRERSVQVGESIRRLETVIAGTQSKGAAGENILEMVFAKLPPEWQVRDFRVGGKSVEFGLRLPNNLILPIDSKWPATDLLERFVACSNPDEQQKLKRDISASVLQKAKEVRRYIDPNVTTSFGIAVVPDSVYDLCPGAQAEAFHMNVVLVSYSMLVPYLLLVFQTTLRSAQAIDLQKLDACLSAIQDGIKALQEELDGRLSRALTMLANSRDDMRAHIGKLGSSVTALQISPLQLASDELPEPSGDSLTG